MRLQLICAAAIISAMTGQVFAQGFGAQKGAPKSGEPERPKSQIELQQERDAERAYKSSLDKIPAKPDVDPWGSARSAEKPATSAKADGKSSAMKSAAPAKPKPAKATPTAN